MLATVVAGWLTFACGTDDGDLYWVTEGPTDRVGGDGYKPDLGPRHNAPDQDEEDRDHVRDPLEIASGSVAPGGLTFDPWPDPVFHSLYCGDNVRGRLEECDSGRPNGFCTAKCRSRDALAVESAPKPSAPGPLPQLLFRASLNVSTLESVMVPGGRVLGEGPHSIAFGSGGFAVTFIDLEEVEPTVRLALYAPDGDRLDVYALGDASSFSYDADPVVAALPDGTFATAWAAFNADDDELGIRLQRVDPETGPLGSPIAANATGVGAQHSPDIVWTESGLVVAWVDHSSAGSRSDLRYRVFDSELEVTSEEVPISAMSVIEDAVSLLPFAGGFAAAFRASQDDGLERVAVSTPEGVFFVADVAPGSAGDRPALAQLDETRLLLVFTEGTDPDGAGVLNTGRLRYSIVDTTGPAELDSTPLDPLGAPYASDVRIAQSQPSAVRSGDAIYVAWRSDSDLGSMLQEEVWLKSIPIDEGVPDLSRVERPLPISNLHRFGHQQAPKLAAGLSGEIVAAWVDYGKNLPGSAGPDVVAETRGVGTETCFAYEQQATPPFSLGMPVSPDGSAAYPYPICRVEQLQYVVDTPALQNKQFVLQADLDVRELTGAFGVTSPFTGTFDGADYALANFTRTLPGQDGVGLFDEVQGDGAPNGVTDGVVKNLVLIEPVIEGLSRSGAVAGLVLANATLENVRVLGGTVTSHGARAGGIAGEVLGRIVESSSSAEVAGVGSASMLGGTAGEVAATGSLIQTSATGAVTGASTDGGGLAGSNLGTISRSWASSSVSGTSRVGGLVGTNRASISNSYARGAVSGSQAGALIGQTESGSNVSKSYATGQVAAGTNVGGLTGFQNASSTYAGGLWDATVNSGLPAVGNLGSAPNGVTSKTTTELQQAATFLAQSWDFVNIWGIDEGDDYPVHLTDGFDFCPEVPQQNTPPFAVGFGADGTVGNPYPICTRAQMQHIADTSSLYDDHYRLMGDINLSGLTSSIGTAANPFKGSFDGNGRRLSNYVRTASSATVGLFGSVFGGTIKNLTVEGFDVRGPGTVGAVAGLVQPGEGRPGVVEDVHVLSSTVRVTTNNVTTVGGLVGRLTGSISGSTASVTVSTNGQTGISRLGGLVGHLDALGVIDSSASTGGVTNGASVGGLVGYQTGGTIEDSFSSATVQTNQSNVGGLVGYATRSGLESALVTRCYASGTVTAAGTTGLGGMVGGLVGDADPAIIRDSWASGATSGSDYNVGGLCGRARGGTVILRSHATGNVSSLAAVGGLIGQITTDVGGQAVAVNVKNSYARGNVTKTVTGTGGTGGLIGAVAGFAGARLSYVYASGTQSSPSAPAGVGGLIGNVSATPTCVAPIWNTTANSVGIGIGSCSGATYGHTSTQLKQQATYTNRDWDFTSVWAIDEGIDFAELLEFEPFLSPLLIDDLEDGDAEIVAHEGRQGRWFTYNDGTGGGTQSPTTATFRGQSPGRDEAFAARTNGSGFTSWGAGMGLDFFNEGSTKELYDASGYGGITFWARAASSISVRLGVPDGNTDTAGGVCSNCSDHFGANLSLTSTWQQFSFRWTQLQQQGWGDDEVAIDPERLYGMVFQAGASTSFDIRVDDVSFLPLDPGEDPSSTSIIDDLEDGNRFILATGGRLGPWFTYNDGTVGGSQSPAAGGTGFLPMTPGFGSSYAARTNGSGFTNWGAGMGLNLNDDEVGARSTYNASAFDGVSFWARAGSAIDVRFNMADVNTDPEGGVCSTCSDHFGANIVLTTSWQHFSFTWAELDQLGWGSSQPAINPAALYAILFQTPPNQTFDFRIDDIAFFMEEP